MKAVIMDEPMRMRVGEWATPEPGPGEVVVEVRAAGICAGDLYLYKGVNPYATYPAIGGHEIAGTISAIGAGVTGLETGMRVVVEPFVGCGACYPCRVGKPNCCANLQIIGIHRPGGYADYVLAPATHLHPIPANLSMVWASFAEPVAIGVQGCRRGQVQAGELALILGCGPIGLALIEVAKARGAHPLAVDINPARRAFAATLGAETLPADENLLAQVMDRTGGEGAPVVLEATGNAQVMESTVDLVAAGGRIVILGLVKRGVRIAFPGLDFTRKEMTVVGSRASFDCFPEALSLLASGRVSYPKVATELSLWEAPATFALLAQDPAALHKGVLIR